MTLILSTKESLMEVDSIKLVKKIKEVKIPKQKEWNIPEEYIVLKQKRIIANINKDIVKEIINIKRIRTNLPRSQKELITNYIKEKFNLEGVLAFHSVPIREINNNYITISFVLFKSEYPNQSIQDYIKQLAARK